MDQVCSAIPPHEPYALQLGLQKHIQLLEGNSAGPLLLHRPALVMHPESSCNSSIIKSSHCTWVNMLSATACTCPYRYALQLAGGSESLGPIRVSHTRVLRGCLSWFQWESSGSTSRCSLHCIDAALWNICSNENRLPFLSMGSVPPWTVLSSFHPEIPETREPSLSLNLNSPFYG